MSDSDCEMPMSIKKQLKKFSLIQFVHKGPKRSVESIDVVPSKWLSFQKKKCVTKYMAPPYDDEDLILINNLIKLNADAPEDWATFTVAVKGEANDYNEAMRKITDLSVKEHVWSLESDESATEAQKDFMEKLKRKKLLETSEKLMHKFSVSKKHNEKENKVLQVFSTNKPTVNTEKNVESVSEETSKALTDISNSIKEFHPKEKSIQISNSLKVVCETDKYYEPDETSMNTVTEDKVEQKIKNNLIHELNVPVIDIDVACKSDFQTAVLEALSQLKADINDMKQEEKELKNKIDEISINLENIQNFLIDKKIVPTSIETNFQNKYDVKIPLSTMDDFLKLNEKLELNTYLRNDICKELMMHLDKDLVISRSIVKILKKFFNKDLALKFTAVRTSADKSKTKFKNTPFCNLIDAVITRARSKKSLDTSPEELVLCLSDVLCNVKRWNST